MNMRYLNHVLRPDEIESIVAALRVALVAWNRDARYYADTEQTGLSAQYQKQVEGAATLLESFEASGF